MYIFDTSSFATLGNYYPSVTPAIWKRVDTLANNGDLRSVREAFRELNQKCHEEHLQRWIEAHKFIFITPNAEELKLVRKMFEKEQCRNLVRYNNILKGTPVSDPFLISAAKVHHAILVTQEKLKKGAAARIPNICLDYGIRCINLEEFMNLEKLHY